MAPAGVPNRPEEEEEEEAEEEVKEGRTEEV